MAVDQDGKPLDGVRRVRVGLMLIDDYALMSSAAAIEPLRAANLLARQDLYDLQFIVSAGGRATSSAGSYFDGINLSDATLDYDYVFVVAGGDPLGYRDPSLNAWLRALHAHGVALGGISGGSVMLARAGVMRNRRFTVHWHHFDALRAESSDYLLERRLFVIDRDRYTCAGGIAALDMMHAIINEHHGVGLARQVADWFIQTNVRLPEAPQRAGAAEKYDIGNPALGAAVELMDNHLGDPLSVSDLATLSGVGRRQLHRLFSTHFGTSIMDFYQSLRLAKANELLEQTILPIHEIGAITGFQNAAHFARVFRARYGVMPKSRRMRKDFAGK